MPDQLRLSREELYQQVWSTPMRSLAVRFGLSDVGLAKICKRMKIPVPSRGHWAKAAAGQTVRRVKLAALAPDSRSHEREATFDLRRVERTQLLTDGRLAQYADFERTPANRVTVRTSLRSPHHQLLTTIQCLEVCRPTDRRLLYATGRGTFDIDVSRRCVKRALRILDALARAVDSRGWEFRPAVNEHGHLVVVVLGHAIGFGLHEQVRRLPEKPATPVRLRSGTFYTPAWSPIEYEPTGLLSLSIDEWWGEGARKHWADGKRQRLEDCLNDFLLGLVVCADAKRAWDEKREESLRLEMEADRRRREAEQRRAEEAARVKALEASVSAWIKSQQVLAFLAALEGESAGEADGATPEGPRASWFTWARGYARELNPLSGRVAMPWVGENEATVRV